MVLLPTKSNKILKTLFLFKGSILKINERITAAFANIFLYFDVSAVCAAIVKNFIAQVDEEKELFQSRHEHKHNKRRWFNEREKSRERSKRRETTEDTSSFERKRREGQTNFA